MPKQVDHEQRRRQLAEALWRITERDGLEAASVRQVALEAGVSPGLVQHYFSSKDAMLAFAMERIGQDLGARLAARVGGLPEPRDPVQVVRIVLEERLPRTPQDRVKAQAALAWTGRAALRPELRNYLVEGTRVLRDYVAARLAEAQETGRCRRGFDPATAADALIAVSDGLSALLLSGVHDEHSAAAVIELQLRLLAA